MKTKEKAKQVLTFYVWEHVNVHFKGLSTKIMEYDGPNNERAKEAAARRWCMSAGVELFFVSKEK